LDATGSIVVKIEIDSFNQPLAKSPQTVDERARACQPNETQRNFMSVINS